MGASDDNGSLACENIGAYIRALANLVLRWPAKDVSYGRRSVVKPSETTSVAVLCYSDWWSSSKKPLSIPYYLNKWLDVFYKSR